MNNKEVHPVFVQVLCLHSALCQEAAFRAVKPDEVSAQL